MLMLFCYYEIENIIQRTHIALLLRKQHHQSEFVFAIVAFIAPIFIHVAFTTAVVYSDIYRESLAVLRLAAFSPQRKWVKVLHKKESSIIDTTYDLLWVSKPYSGLHFSELRRIQNDGTHSVLYKVYSKSLVQEILIYDLPDPYFKSSLSQIEYKPTICILRKNNTITRYDLLSGVKYNTIFLGTDQFRHLSWNQMQDEMILTSQKIRNILQDLYIVLKIFNLHPFEHKGSVAILNSVFLGKEHKHFGKLQSIEIAGGLLLIMTDKGFILCYSMDEIIKCIPATSLPPRAHDPPYFVKSSPILFSTKAHMDIVGFGGFPWMYIKAVSDAVLEVRNLSTQELIENGSVSFDSPTDQKIAPDHLSFHFDGSNRLIHLKNSDIRILSINDGKNGRNLRCDFQYGSSENIEPPTRGILNSRRHRFKQKFAIDNSMNRALVFGFELDLRIFFILEAERHMNHGVKLERVTFYDITTYEALSALNVNVTVEGDIDTNNTMVFMDKDLLTIVSKNKNTSTIIAYRLLCEDSERNNKCFMSSSPLNRHPRSRSLNGRNYNRFRNVDSDEEWVP